MRTKASISPPHTATELLNVVDSCLANFNKESPVAVVLVEPPFEHDTGLPVTVTPLQAAPLKSSSISKDSPTVRWPEERLQAIHYYTLCCVTEGEIDWRVGVTYRSAPGNMLHHQGIGRYILRIPSGTFFLMPPGVPFDDGSALHWLDSTTAVPNSRIFFVSVLPSGAFVHTCHTITGDHQRHPSVFVTDSHLVSLIELLNDDLQDDSFETSQMYLKAILYRVRNAISDGKYLDAASATTLIKKNSQEQSISHDTALVSRACRYIESHLNRPLTVAHIASQVHVSISHLCSTFRSELGTSPVRYVTQRRMEVAQKFLAETEMPIHRISTYFGYSNPDIFSRAFKRWSGVSPLHYRRLRERGQHSSA